MTETTTGRRQQYNFKFHPSLLQALRDQAHDEGTTVTALLERGAYHVLGRQVGDTTKRQPTASRLAAPRAPAAEGGEARPAQAGVAPQAASQAPVDPMMAKCAACGHARFHHGERGCKGVCNCSTRRFRPPVEGT